MSEEFRFTRRIFLKGVAGLGLGAAASGILSACGPTPAPATAPATSPAAGKAMKGKITVWAWDQPDKAFKDIVPGFKGKYPDIDVDVVTVPWDQIHTKLSTAIEAGSGAPDMCMIEGYFMPTFAGPGVVDLTEKMAPYRKDIAAAKFTEVEFNGKVWGIPWDLPPALLFYRPDLFEEAGVTEIPKTWDKYVTEVGAKVTKGKDRFLFAIDPSTGPGFYWYRPLLAQIGSGYIDKEGKVLLGDEKSIRVAQWMADAINKQKVALTGVQYFEGPSWWSALKDNKVASVLGAVWMVGMMKDQVPEQAGKWKVTLLPVFDEGNPEVTYLGGSSVVIPAQSKNQELAWAFAEYALLTTEGTIGIYKSQNLWPAYLPALQDKAFDEPDPYFSNQPIARYFADQTPKVGNYYYTKKMDEAESKVNAHLFKILTGAEEAGSGIKAAAEELKAL